MAGIQSTEPIGTTARLGVLRLDAGRLAALPRTSQLKPGTGIYAWVRSDGIDGLVNHGQPPGAQQGGWTTVRS